MLSIVALHIGLALWLFSYFSKRDRGAKEPRRALYAACFFSIIGLLIAGELNNTLLPHQVLNFIDGKTETVPPLAASLSAGLIVGVIEESLKFVPLALWIYKKRYFNEITDGVVYFALCGMWFGAVESIQYALMHGEGVGLMRLIIGPFSHAAYTGLAGLGLALYKVKKTSLAVPVGLFLSAVLLHGLYDFFLFSSVGIFVLWAMAITVLINVGLFRIYLHAQHDDELLGLSAVGVNKFCRQCGAPNPNATLFCTACGNKT